MSQFNDDEADRLADDVEALHGSLQRVVEIANKGREDCPFCGIQDRLEDPHAESCPVVVLYRHSPR